MRSRLRQKRRERTTLAVVSTRRRSARPHFSRRERDTQKRESTGRSVRRIRGPSEVVRECRIDGYSFRKPGRECSLPESRKKSLVWQLRQSAPKQEHF